MCFQWDLYLKRFATVWVLLNLLSVLVHKYRVCITIFTEIVVTVLVSVNKCTICVSIGYTNIPSVWVQVSHKYGICISTIMVSALV